MSRYIVSENDIYRLILQELNTNKMGVHFEMANYYSNDSDGKLYIMRQAFNVDNGTFDVVEELNEETYVTTRKRFTAVGIGGLNADLLSHPSIVEINYSPIVNFLVYVGDNEGDDIEFIANKTAIEEIRSNLLHKEFNLEVEHYDRDNLSSETKITQRIKGVFASGEIDYGNLEVINGKFYMVLSLPINIFVTTSGEFANSQEFIFSVEDLLDGSDNPIKFNIPLLTWHYGKGLDTNDFQLMATKGTNGLLKASEVRGLPVSKAFALTFLVQIDFDNPFLDYIYEESQNERLKSPRYTITMNTYKYVDGVREEIPHKTNTRDYYLIQNMPSEELSLGEKIEHVLIFSVAKELD